MAITDPTEFNPLSYSVSVTWIHDGLQEIIDIPTFMDGGPSWVNRDDFMQLFVDLLSADPSMTVSARRTAGGTTDITPTGP